MLDVLSITGVIFVLIGVGFLVVRRGVFAPEEMRVLGKFVVNLALPALIFRAVTTRPLSDLANPAYLLAMLAGSLAVFWLGYGVSRRMGGGVEASTFRGMGMSCANSGFVGFPLLAMAMPDVAGTALAMNMIVENLVMLPMVLVLAERGQGGGAVLGQVLLRLAKNPMVLALVLGMAITVAEVPVPLVLARSVDVVAQGSAAVSLTVIGGTLAGLSLRSVSVVVAPVALGKLVLHPLAVFGCLVWLAALGVAVGNPRLEAAAIIMASTPPMAIYPVLAQRFGQEGEAALAMFVMTVLSFASMSLVMALVL